jgi:intracellular multiplication protein IcmV
VGAKKVIKNTLLKGFQVNRWLGVDNIKRDTHFVAGFFKNLFSTRKEETASNSHKRFEDYVAQYQLTEDDLNKRMKQLKQMVWLCIGLSVPVFIYAGYLLSLGQVLNFLVCAMLGFILWAHAFREHFNYFQMKQRRLGCTKKEWFSSLLRK